MGDFRTRKKLICQGWTKTSQWEEMLPHSANIASVLGSFSMNWVVPKERFLSRIINSSKNLVMRMYWISLCWISKRKLFWFGDWIKSLRSGVVSGFILIFVFDLYVTWQKTHMCLAPQWFVYLVCFNLNFAAFIGLVAGKCSREARKFHGENHGNSGKTIFPTPVITKNLPGIVPLFEPFRSFDSGAEEQFVPSSGHFWLCLTFLVTFPEQLGTKAPYFLLPGSLKKYTDRFWSVLVKRDQLFTFTMVFSRFKNGSIQVLKISWPNMQFVEETHVCQFVAWLKPLLVMELDT